MTHTNEADIEGGDLPDSIILLADRRRWLVVLLISAGFVALAIWMASLGSWPAWIFGGWFLFRGLVALPQVLGIGSRLRLNRDGFVCRTPLRKIHHRWSECSAFSPKHMWLSQLVSFSLLDGQSADEGAGSGAKPAGTKLLPDTFGRSPQELCDLMNAFRARALG
jgi:hypothetical protein